MIVLRKEISRKIEGNTEHVEYEYYKKDVLDKSEIDALLMHYDDYEEGYCAGLAIDYNDELVWIDSDRLFEALSDYLDNCDEEDKETGIYKTFKGIKEKLSKWEGFTIWI